MEGDERMVERTLKPLSRMPRVSLRTFCVFLFVCLIGAGLWIHSLEAKVKSLQQQLDDSSKRIEDAEQNYETAKEENNARVQLELARIDIQVLNVGVAASSHLSQLGEAIGKLNRSAASGQTSETQRSEIEKHIQQLQNDAAQLRALRTQAVSKEKTDAPAIAHAPVLRSVIFLAVILLGVLSIIVPISIRFGAIRARKKPPVTQLA